MEILFGKFRLLQARTSLERVVFGHSKFLNLYFFALVTLSMMFVTKFTLPTNCWLMVHLIL